MTFIGDVCLRCKRPIDDDVSWDAVRRQLTCNFCHPPSKQEGADNASTY